MTRAILLVGLTILGGCVPARYITHTRLSAPVVVGDALVMSATTSQFGRDDERFIVRCPSATLASNTAACEWYPMTSTAPESEIARVRRAAAATAAADHGCAPQSTVVQSGEPASGFWIAGCGRQWFYRQSGSGWTDDTPAR